MSRKFVIGDVVVCNCESRVWYKGIPGLVVDINWLGDPKVLINGKLIELAGSAVEIL